MFDLAGSIPASQLCYACFILGNADSVIFRRVLKPRRFIKQEEAKEI